MLIVSLKVLTIDPTLNENAAYLIFTSEYGEIGLRMRHSRLNFESYTWVLNSIIFRKNYFLRNQLHEVTFIKESIGLFVFTCVHDIDIIFLIANIFKLIYFWLICLSVIECNLLNIWIVWFFFCIFNEVTLYLFRKGVL